MDKNARQDAKQVRSSRKHGIEYSISMTWSGLLYVISAENVIFYFIRFAPSLQTIKKIENMTEIFRLSDNLTAASVFRVLFYFYFYFFLYIRFDYMRGMYVDSET